MYPPGKDHISHQTGSSEKNIDSKEIFDGISGICYLVPRRVQVMGLSKLTTKNGCVDFFVVLLEKNKKGKRICP